MPDIREILAALTPDDRAMYMEARNNMRANYLYAHNSAVGVSKWDQSDDSFFDLIDIRLALLFDRGGKLNAPKTIIDVDNGHRVEQELKDAEDKMKNRDTKPIPDTNAEPSEASKKLANGGWK